MRYFFVSGNKLPGDEFSRLGERVHRLLLGGRVMTKSNSLESATSNPVEEAALDGAALDPKVLDTIGRALKAHYDDLVHAPLPQKFLALLARLEEQEQEELSQEKPAGHT